MKKKAGSPWEQIMLSHLTGGAPMSPGQQAAMAYPQGGLAPEDIGMSSAVQVPQVPADAITRYKAVMTPQGIRLVPVIPEAQAAQ